MKKNLFNFLLEKENQKTITSVQEKVLDLYLQIDVLRQYFDIVLNYCKTSKIQKEVEEMRPAWSGYENYYWYTYHYDTFGNALYSYAEIYKSILNLLAKNIHEFPNDGKIWLDNFIADDLIEEMLDDRHDSVHQVGKWRSRISNELSLQDWKKAEEIIVVPLAKAHRRVIVFDKKITEFINEQLQLEE